MDDGAYGNGRQAVAGFCYRRRKHLFESMAHKDPVTPEMRARVIQLDGGCVAPKIDPAQAAKCWGRLTLDHVNCRSTRGKRAPSNEGHLATLCQGHTEDGRKAGYQWNTANRPALRTYLAPRHIPHEEKLWT